jgi:hypothetical protein
MKMKWSHLIGSQNTNSKLHARSNQVKNIELATTNFANQLFLFSVAVLDRESENIMKVWEKSEFLGNSMGFGDCDVGETIETIGDCRKKVKNS